MGRGYLLIAIAPALLAGCVPLPYAYPTVKYVPPVDIEVGDQSESLANQVHVFRVAIDRVSGSPEFAHGDSCTLKEVGASDTHAPAQLTGGITYGWYWWHPALIYAQHNEKSVEVRVYCRGYRTRILEPWDFSRKIVLEPRTSLEECEAAIDDVLIFRGKPLGAALEGSRAVPLNGIRAGSASPEHRKALLFVAEEYLALARSEAARQSAGAVERLEKKAADVEELARK